MQIIYSRMWQVKVAFERGKNATKAQADKALMTRAREEALETIRKELWTEMEEVSAWNRPSTLI